MSPLCAGASAVGKPVAVGTTIEDAIGTLTHDPQLDQLTVVGEGNQPLGTVNLRQLACALTVPTQKHDGVQDPTQGRSSTAHAQNGRGAIALG